MESTLKRNSNAVNKKFMEYFFPTVLTAMTNNFALIVDSIIVGNLLGSPALAAVNLLSPIIQLYFALTLLFGLGASSLISIAKGGQKQDEVNSIFTIGLGSLCALSVILIAVQLIFLNPIVAMLTPEQGLQELVKQYYIPYIIGTPFTLLLTGLSYAVRTDGKPKLASNCVIIANAVNLCFDFVLVGGLQIGIMGSSIATVFGNFVGFIIILSHFKSKDNGLFLDFNCIKNKKILIKQFATLTAVGASGALGAMLITIRLAFLNTFVQQLSDGGSLGMVALSVNSSCQILISTFITGASQTMIPIVGVMLGQKDYEGVRLTLKKTWRILLIANIIIFALLELFPEAVSSIFGISGANEISLVVTSIRITTISFVGLSASFMMLYYYMATKRKAISTMISIINGVALIIPLSLLLGNMFGIVGVWWAFVVTQIGTLLIAYVVVLVYRKNAKHSFDDFYLLPHIPKSEVASFSFKNDDEEIFNTVKNITQFMQTNHVSNLVAMKIAVVIEELSVNATAKRGYVYIDARISVNHDEVVLSFRDNGVACNPLETKKEIWSGLDISSMGVVNSLIKNMEYANILGFNQTTLVIDNTEN